MRERAADRAAMPHLRVADLRRPSCETIGQCSCSSGSSRDRLVPGQRADREVRAGVADVGELGQPADVDELRRPREAELHRRASSEWPPASSFASSLRRRAARARARRSPRPRSRTVRGSLLRLLDRAPDTLGRGRHLDVGHAEVRERVDDRVDHRGRRGDRAVSPTPFTPSGFVGLAALRRGRARTTAARPPTARGTWRGSPSCRLPSSS